MNIRSVIMILVLAIGGLGIYLWNNQTPTIDLVHDIAPRSDRFAKIGGIQEALEKLPENERQAYINKKHPNLAQGAVFELRQQGRLTKTDEIDRVQFWYGSMENVVADDKDGVRHTGKFDKQIVASVFTTADKRLDIILYCTNGMFVTPEQFVGMQTVGDHRIVEQFIVAQGQGLVTYVDFPMSIDLAEMHNLDLIKQTWGGVKTPITADEARALEPDTDKLWVKVKVFPGDKFDLVAGTYNGKLAVKSLN